MTNSQLDAMTSSPARWLEAHRRDARARLDATRSIMAEVKDSGNLVVTASARLALQDAMAVAEEWRTV